MKNKILITCFATIFLFLLNTKTYAQGSLKIANGGLNLSTVTTPLFLNNSPGLFGQVPVSQGPGLTPIWTTISFGGSGWSLSGNTNTNPPTDFLGTTDAKDFVIKTNGIERMRILSTGQVGIGVTNPTANLEVNGNNGFLARGAFGSGGIPTTGVGTRMMWYPNKGAFRVGRVSTTQWDDANIGNYSNAFGVNSIASGQWTFVIGNGCSASSNYSFSGGNISQSTGGFSFSYGDHSNATGNFSFAFGDHCNTLDLWSVAFGITNTSGGEASVTLGSTNSTSQERSFAIGSVNNVLGWQSGALGQNSTVTGDVSFTLGNGLLSNSDGVIILGQNNLGLGVDPTNWIATDPIFELGNGTSSGARSNALTVLKNGKVGISVSAPQTMLDVNDFMKIVPRASAPASPQAGWIYYDSTLNKLRCFDGTVWQNLW